ncbi:DNA polymerase III subunit delta [Kocuria carniphila]|uniref:DNA polymerase III subunit delta n=1 Tax=Kocuria carniphila TaxID=262208 RepID=UPI0028EC1DF2|nr:DNA polymerase III subunit delta [Kocuria carniphila]
MAATRRSTPSNPGTSWREAARQPLVLATGSDEYLIQRVRESLRDQIREERGTCEVTLISAADYAPGQLSVVTSPSLFDEPKLVCVTELSSMNENLLMDALSYVKSPDPEVTVLWEHGGGNRGKKLLDAIKEKALVVDCAPLKSDRDKSAFILAEFKQHGKRIEPDAARALAAAVGTSTAELAAACAQLISDGPTTIDHDLVEKYYGGRVEVTAFRVADAAVAGNADQALKLWRQAVDVGVDPVPMVAALGAKLRLIALVAGSRGSSGSVARDVGAAPWQVDRAQNEARRFTPGHVIEALKAIAHADAQVKGESRTPYYAVERAITVIATSGRH